jgi:hypothetical protein
MFCRPSPSKAVALTSRLSSLPSYSYSSSSFFSDSTYTHILSRDIAVTYYTRSRSNLQGCYCEIDEKRTINTYYYISLYKAN